jgi:hypothetical protein
MHATDLHNFFVILYAAIHTVSPKKNRSKGVRLLHFFRGDFGQVATKHFPIDQCVEIGKEFVELTNFIELVFDIEE